MSMFSELKSRIVALNISKNDYANRKLKNDVTDSDTKDMISSLIYIIAELRRCASDIGISDDGKINREVSEIEEFKKINDDVKELKRQVIFLTEKSVEEIKEEKNRQKDEHQKQVKKEAEKKEENNVKTATSRRDEQRARLQQQLQKLTKGEVSQQSRDTESSKS